MQLLSKIYKDHSSFINKELQDNYNMESKTGNYGDYSNINYFNMLVLYFHLFYDNLSVEMEECIKCAGFDYSYFYNLMSEAQLRQVGGDNVGQEVSVYPETIVNRKQEDIFKLLNIQEYGNTECRI